MIYLDSNATMPMLPAAATAVRKYLTAQKLNPKVNRQVIADAREQVLNLFGADGKVVFTSGGTENAAIAFSTTLYSKRTNKVVCSLADHISVLNQHSALSDKLRATIDILPVTADGNPDPAVFQQKVGTGTGLLTLNLVNSETGVINMDVAQMAQAAKSVGALVFLDACQAVGRMSLKDIPKDVDMVSISAHKFGGPRGVGALWVRPGVEVFPAWGGGFQQSGMRSGTENTAGIAGMAAALKHVEKNMQKDFDVISALRTYLDRHMLQIQDLTINFGNRLRVCNTSSYLIKGINCKVLTLLMHRRGIIISDGTAGLAETSAVSPLMMFLHSADDCYSNIRISLCRNNTQKELEKAAGDIAQAVKTLRKLFPTPFPAIPQ
jgi:cysteine desulfurase